MNGLLFRCLIIDDEPSAQELLKRYVSDTAQLTLAGICNDALEAREFLQQEPSSVDLLLLDINMPKLSGIGFLKSISDPPAVILTTAYDEYALEGYELDVIDYLLKPFSFERFLKAVSKLEKSASPPPEPGQSFLLVKADKKTFKVDLNDILYIESMGDYLSVVTSSGKLTTHGTLKRMEDQLPSAMFMRVHKSYMISIRNADFLEGNMVGIGDTKIPIGTTYRDGVKQYFS